MAINLSRRLRPRPMKRPPSGITVRYALAPSAVTTPIVGRIRSTSVRYWPHKPRRRTKFADSVSQSETRFVAPGGKISLLRSGIRRARTAGHSKLPPVRTPQHTRQPDCACDITHSYGDPASIHWPSGTGLPIFHETQLCKAGREFIPSRATVSVSRVISRTT